MNEVNVRSSPTDDGREDIRAGRAAIAQWFALEELAGKEPSLPVWKPRTKRQRALVIRVDAQWRALLARARTLPEIYDGTGHGDGSGEATEGRWS